MDAELCRRDRMPQRKLEPVVATLCGRTAITRVSGLVVRLRQLTTRPNSRGDGF